MASGKTVAVKVHFGLLVWISIYALWNVIGRNAMEGGPVFKVPLFLWVRQTGASTVMFIINLVSVKGNVRELLPARRDLGLILQLGLATAVNQGM